VGPETHGLAVGELGPEGDTVSQWVPNPDDQG
jgi:hypothetical protein